MVRCVPVMGVVYQLGTSCVPATARIKPSGTSGTSLFIKFTKEDSENKAF